eukprot:GDKK01001011.1.p1 GENE.GDKK01001011.1~~GDKK01001011.1.p1  ORF type:complete len:282 (+),score=92.45 GDKK01001011.1:28-873(+)
MVSSPQSRHAMTVRNRTPRVDFFKFDEDMDGTPRLDHKRIKAGNTGMSPLNGSGKKRNILKKSLFVVFGLVLLVSAFAAVMLLRSDKTPSLTSITANLRGSFDISSIKDVLEKSNIMSKTRTSETSSETNPVESKKKLRGQAAAQPAVQGTADVVEIIEVEEAIASNDNDEDGLVGIAQDVLVPQSESEDDEELAKKQMENRILKDEVPVASTQNLRGSDPEALPSTPTTAPVATASEASAEGSLRKKKKKKSTTTTTTTTSTQAAEKKKKKKKKKNIYLY